MVFLERLAIKMIKKLYMKRELAISENYYAVATFLWSGHAFKKSCNFGFEFFISVLCMYDVVLFCIFFVKPP